MPDTNRVSAAWVRPLDTDPGLFIDREDKREQLRSFVLDEIDAGDGEARILVAGDRGVGKSIFGRAVLDEIAAARKQQLIAVHVDGRNRSEFSFLKGFAARLATAGIEMARYLDQPVLDLWFRQLALVANSDTFTWSQAESIRRERGADLGVELTLMGALDARGGLHWKETRDLGQVVARTQEVDPDLLVASISHVLERVRSAGLFVVVFHDDLDQAIDAGNPQGAKDALTRILSARPCVAIAHIRNEMLAAEIRREFEETVELDELSAQVLVDLLKARAQAAGQSGQDALDANGVLPDFQRLSQVTGNPLAFLRWAFGYLRLYPRPPAPQGWHDAQALAELVRRVGNLPVPPDLLLRLVDICEQAVGAQQTQALQRKWLLEADPAQGRPPLTKDDLEFLETAGVLIKRSRFEPDTGYRLDPVVRLLLPSLAARLRQP